MAPPKVFFTGATGYIGGDVFYNVIQAHPDWEVSALVRNKDKAAQLTSKYPNVRVVIGDLDSVDVIEEETKNADIVFNCADCDHVASAEAIARGLAHHTPEKPVWLIHTSGTGILTVEDFRTNTWGLYRTKEHDDWEGVDELVNKLPEDSLHRDVDKIIIEAGRRSPDSVKTAIVCPPTIYGPGRGPGNQKSIQAYWLTVAVLKRKKGILVGEGKNVWHQVHVQDLSDLYRLLGDAAVAGGGKATWNNEGYYLAENGPFVWGDIQREVARVAYEKKLIPSPEVDSLTDAEVTALNKFGLYAWGSSSRGHAHRARKLLGWSPSKPSLKELIPEIVDIEAKDLGLVFGIPVMAPGAGGKRKRGDRSWSGDSTHDGQRPSPHRPGGLNMAQHPHPSPSRDYSENTRGRPRRQPGRGGRGGFGRRHSGDGHPQPTVQPPSRPPPPFDYEYVTDSVVEEWAATGRQRLVENGIRARNEEDVSLFALYGRLPPVDAGAAIKDVIGPDVAAEDVDMAGQGQATAAFDPRSLFLDTLSIVTESDTSNVALRPLVFSTAINPALMRLQLETPLLQSLGLTNLLYRQSNYNLLREESEGYSKLLTELFTTSNNEPPSSEVVEDTFEKVKAMVGAFDMDVGRVLDVTLDVFAAVLVKQYRFFVKLLRVSSWWPKDDIFRSSGRDNRDSGLPNWALPGSSGWITTDEERLQAMQANEHRDHEFWNRVREIGIRAFFEIGREPISKEELNRILPESNSLSEDEVKIRKWVDETGTLPPKGSRVAAQLLGFKLRFYSSRARSKADVLPDNLIYLAALLIKVGFISLRDLYPHLWRPDDSMEALKEEKIKEKAERERAARPGGGINALMTAGALSDDTLPAPRMRDSEARSATPGKDQDADKAAAKAEEDELPEPSDQKVLLLKSLLAIGALPESLFFLSRFPWLMDTYPELPEFIHRIIHQCLSKVYASLRPPTSTDEFKEPKQIMSQDQSGVPKGQIRLAQAPPPRVLRWAQLDKEDTNDGTDYRFYWDDWADNVPICQTVDDVFALCSSFLNLSGHKIGQDPSLLAKLSRIGKDSLKKDNSPENRARWQDLCKRLLLPSISLTKANPGVVNEVFDLVSFFPRDTRYNMYAEWYSGQTSRLPDIKSAFDQARAETKDVLKRLSKTNIRPMARALAKIAFANPGIVINVAISQIESYENLIEVVVECARYFTNLGYDVLTWGLISSLGQKGRSRLLDKRHESKTTSKRLMKSLTVSKLAGQLLIAIAQERWTCVFKESDGSDELKLLGNVFDEIHRILAQYLDLLRSNLTIDEFDAFVPDLASLVRDFGVQPEIAFWIRRPSVAKRIAEVDKATQEEAAAAAATKSQDIKVEVPETETDKMETADDGEPTTTEAPAVNSMDVDKEQTQQTDVDAANATEQTTGIPAAAELPPLNSVIQDLQEQVKSALPSDNWNVVGLHFYVTFWQLSIYDVHIPQKAYEDEIDRQKRKVMAINNDRSDISMAGTQRKEREKKQITQLQDQILEENKAHLKSYGRTRGKLQKEKDRWFAGMRGKHDSLNVALLEQCFLPRLLLSPIDAFYCFKMLKVLHTSGTPNFRTVGLLDQLFREQRLTALIFQCTSREADNLGCFLNETLRDLTRWHASKSVYEKEAFGNKKDLPGFAMNVDPEGKPTMFLEYEDFRRLLYKWHRLIAAALKICLNGGEYMHIRNAISVLKAIVQHFPAVNWIGRDMLTSVNNLSQQDERDDVKIPAASLIGDLNRREKKWMLPQEFMITNQPLAVGKGKNDSTSGKPGTPRPKSTTPAPLNAAAAEFQPSAANE
ncbi:transcription factor/nuclear export subunit protein 2-domain-containing protein [Aspergillus taichungensis]|uniref:THO complex subunit 2 n=1 Tax=Aspergillus taichungensis TaxID=482145 RepID=A0A2J5I0A8_9EURO|nr:transcription factor/nuclear export subunit protein 2-domain-containing protein [Aspergillus taichungensis]